MGRNNNIIKCIVELKKESQKLEDLINFVKMENFDYALKCNHIENILSNINSIAKNTPGKLLQASDNICNVLQICGTSTTASSASASPTEKKPVAAKLTPEKVHACNKAHVVKPHMVNGTILYIPTINLTRVSDMHLSSTSKSSSQRENENNSLERCSSSNGTNGTASQPSSSARFIENTESEAEVSTSGDNNHEFNDESQHSLVEEVSEPSTSTAKSPSHSTVLSGTFQEVKIYLNQISPESVNEESRKSSSKTRLSSKLSSGPGVSRKNKKSNSSSFGSITKRRRT